MAVMGTGQILLNIIIRTNGLVVIQSIRSTLFGKQTLLVDNIIYYYCCAQ